jgi:hypothetical protein
MDVLNNFKKEAFRLELLDEYSVPEENEYKLFLEGEYLSSQRNNDWCNLVRKIVSTNRIIHRIHIIPTQLTPYLKYEIDWDNNGTGEAFVPPTGYENSGMLKTPALA